MFFKRYIWILVLFQMICVLSGVGAHAQNVAQKASQQLVFSATPSAKGIVYKIDGKIISDQLRGFGIAIEKHGEQFPVVCVIDSRLPILVVGNAVAAAEKAGFKSVRSFVMDHSTGKISEIRFGPWTSASD